MNSVTLNGTTVDEEWGDYNVQLQAGDVVAIDAGSAKREAKAIVWVDDAEKASWNRGLSRSDNSPFDDLYGMLETG